MIWCILFLFAFCPFISNINGAPVDQDMKWVLQKIKYLENENAALKEKVNNQLAANDGYGFYARPSGNQDITAGSNIVYSEVLTNYGEAYSANSGFFIAPVNGVYLFSAFFQSVGGADTSIELFRGNVPQCFMQGLADVWPSASCTVVLELLAGEEVYLRGADGFPNGQVRGDEDGASGFAGHLIMQTS